MQFFKSRIFVLTVLIQLAGPFLLSFGNWANVIQYVSGFGIAYALWNYLVVHKREIQKMQEQLVHLHHKHDELQRLMKGEKNHV